MKSIAVIGGGTMGAGIAEVCARSGSHVVVIGAAPEVERLKAAVAQSMYEQFKETRYAPPPLLLRMVDAGLLGRTTGRGFFPYGR